MGVVQGVGGGGVLKFQIDQSINHITHFPKLL